MATKGPLDKLKELRQKEADLRARIKKGESGDGNKKPDLNAQLKIVVGDRRNLEEANKPKRDPKKLYPKSDHN